MPALPNPLNDERGRALTLPDGTPAEQRRVRFGLRCTCHHPGRHCFIQCGGRTEVVRPSDNRPVCAWCVPCNPNNAAGFRVEAFHFEEVAA